MGKWPPSQKGFYGDITEDTLNWMKDTIEAVWNAAGGEGELNDLIDEGKSKEFLKNLYGSDHGWTKEADSFGTKLYKELIWGAQPNGAKTKYRITVVLTPRGELKLDVHSRGQLATTFREFYSVAEVAELMRVSKMTIYRWVDEHPDDVVRLRHNVRIKGKAVKDMMGE